jgi:protein-tyrosine-phosphatase
MSADLFGVDLSSHRSVIVDAQTLAWADMIVVMDRWNWDGVEKMGGAALRKTLWLGALGDGRSVEVQDPYGRSPAQTERILQQMETCAGRLCRELVANRK